MSIKRLTQNEISPKYDLGLKVHTVQCDKEDNQLSFKYPAATATLDVQPQPNDIRFYIPPQSAGTTEVNLLDPVDSSNPGKFAAQIEENTVANLEFGKAYLVRPQNTGAITLNFPAGTDDDAGESIYVEFNMTQFFGGTLTINAPPAAPGELGVMFAGFGTILGASNLLTFTQPFLAQWTTAEYKYVYLDGTDIPFYGGRIWSFYNINYSFLGNLGVALNKVPTEGDGLVVRPGGTWDVSAEANWNSFVIQTTDATPTDMGSRALQTAGSAITYIGKVIGTDGTDTYSGDLSATFSNIAGVVAAVGVSAVGPRQTVGAITWSSQFVVAGTLISLEVTGEAGKTIDWKYSYHVTETP